MKKIKIFGDNYSGYSNKIRYAVRGIVIKDDKILLNAFTKQQLYMIPGGGTEKNETPEQALVRELAEETGYLAQVIKPVIYIEEFYETKHGVNTF